MTRAILRQSVREAYLAVDRVVREAAGEVETLLAGWGDWTPTGTSRLLVTIAAKLRLAWLTWLPLALRSHLERTRLRVLALAEHPELRARIARRLASALPIDAWTRLQRQYRWIVARVSRIVREAAQAPGVTGEAVSEAVTRFLHPRFAQVAFLGTGSIVRRFASSGAFAGSYARLLFREETSRAYGETMGAIAAGDPAVIGERWVLSPAHRGPADACDRKANADAFHLGRGVYPPGQFPEYPSHVGCVCSRELVRAERGAA